MIVTLKRENGPLVVNAFQISSIEDWTYGKDQSLVVMSNLQKFVVQGSPTEVGESISSALLFFKSDIAGKL